MNSIAPAKKRTRRNGFWWFGEQGIPYPAVAVFRLRVLREQPYHRSGKIYQLKLLRM